jgi:GNAT superfamily N-acetyltransferase
LTPDRFADLAGLFDEGGDPKWCSCMFFRLPGMTWRNASEQSNRDDLERLSHNEVAPGLVAYRDELAIGWVGLAPRSEYGRLATSKVLKPIDDKPVWSIVCFVVSRHARRQGVGHELLKAAVQYAQAHGATIVEAYPVASERGRVPAADAYHGTQSMFERAGFSVVDIRQWNATSPRRPIMRLELR